jgi:hypothetical protein
VQADQTATAEEDDDQVVTRITQHFMTPEQPVVASREHSNSIHEYNKDGVKAYAKVAAHDWTYYVTKLIVNIGRSSEPANQRRAESENPEERDDPTAVHIDLGPSKLISRQHASIYFDGNESKWCLEVKGRNALKVNGEPWKPKDNRALSSGDVIEVGGVEMMFVLPAELSPLNIAPQYLERASGRPRATSGEASRSARHPLPSDGYGAHSSPQSRARGPGSVQRSLAPAPPDYRRPGTPPSSAARIRATPAHRAPHLPETPVGPMMMSHSDVDLSLDENKHIKPQYSYAQMITQAITSTEEGKLNLSGIYSFIMNRYSYYRHQQPNGWQVRYPGI